MDGQHLTADLSGCPLSVPAMTEPAALRELCLNAVTDAGLRPVAELFHRFEPVAAAASASAPPGITGVVLLAESHLAVHTWPELGAVTLDVYVCNVGGDNNGRAHRLLEALCGAFSPTSIDRQSLRRGRVGNQSTSP